MKTCPVCHQNYHDDSLNFCLEDGAALSLTATANETEAATIFSTRAQTSRQSFDQKNAQSQRSASPPEKKSRAWLWVGGIAGGVILLGIAGIIGLIALAMNFSDANRNISDTARISSANNQSNSALLSDDFSKWKRGETDIGDSDFQNGEFIARSKLENFYYILMTGDDNFITTEATTRLTVRNPTGKSSLFGFGLVVRTNPAASTRYAFLIDSSRQSYRVVLHLNNKETTVVNWTKSAAIRAGTQKNELKVKDEKGTMTFFINNQSVTTVRDTTGLKDGIAGIYTSGAVPIAFSALERTK